MSGSSSGTEDFGRGSGFDEVDGSTWMEVGLNQDWDLWLGPNPWRMEVQWLQAQQVQVEQLTRQVRWEQQELQHPDWA